MSLLLPWNRSLLPVSCYWRQQPFKPPKTYNALVTRPEFRTTRFVLPGKCSQTLTSTARHAPALPAHGFQDNLVGKISIAKLISDLRVIHYWRSAKENFKLSYLMWHLIQLSCGGNYEKRWNGQLEFSTAQNTMVPIRPGAGHSLIRTETRSLLGASGPNMSTSLK